MTGLVDIHCHILPGIDDGPETIGQALEMARAAQAVGVATLAATPHLRSDFPMVKVDEIADRCDELREVLRENSVPIQIRPGAEVSLSWALEADEAALRTASYAQRGEWLLIETPMTGGTVLPSLLSMVQTRGYRVLLAHPERLSEFQQTPHLVNRLVELGIHLQVNADAIVGSARRSRSAKLGQWLLRRGLVSVISSDSHRGTEWRPITRLSDAQRTIASSDSDLASLLLSRNPSAVLNGGQLPAVQPRETKARRGFGLFGR